MTTLSSLICALLGTSALDCWGYDDFADLGDGAVGDSNVPVAVSGLTGVTNLSYDGYGNDTQCAVLYFGGVDCWGYGESGELGNGSDENSDVPVEVVGIGP